MKIKKHSCTSMMVGKNASIDGNTYIARNEDNYVSVYPKRFYVQEAVNNRDETYTSVYTGLTVKLPKSGYRYTTSPDTYQEEGLYEEDGINEKNVCVSATESVLGNNRVLAYDPLVKNGVGEDSIVTLVLPYIDSARQGVEYLGELFKKYGSAECNGIQFSDKDEVWYMEVTTGHHWVAVRIPDDYYAVAANQTSIEDIDFNDPTNYLWSPGIKEFVAQHKLNPDENRWSYRRIFGTDTLKDRHYNTPRVWYGQKILNPNDEQDPESSDLPFMRKAEKKISVEDIQYILKSHFNETKYDPLGSGSEHDKKLYRAISLSRTANSHILQMRDPEEFNNAGIEWKCFGIPSFCPFVPFFTNANDTDPSFSNMSKELNLKDAFWLYETLATVVESHYKEYLQPNLDYQEELSQWAREKIEFVDNELKNLPADQVVDYLTKQNHEIAQYFNDKTKKHLADLILKGADLSKLTFEMDPNL